MKVVKREERNKETKKAKKKCYCFLVQMLFKQHVIHIRPKHPTFYLTTNRPAKELNMAKWDTRSRVTQMRVTLPLCYCLQMNGS